MSMINVPVQVSFSSYVESGRYGATYCRALAEQLHGAMPSDASAAEKRSIKIVIDRAELVKAAISDREREAPARVQAQRQEFANAWSACLEITGGVARIEGQKGDDARALNDTLFVDGIAFVRLDTLAAWGEGQRVLDRITDEGLGKRLEGVVGKDVIAEMKRATDALGEAIGVGGAHRESATKAPLAELVASFARSVAAYARVLSSAVDEEDAASVARFVTAMAPIDAYRASRQGSSGAADPGPAAPSQVQPVVAPSVTTTA